MKTVQKQSKPKKMAKPKRTTLGLAMPNPSDIETKHIEDEAEPFGSNFA